MASATPPHSSGSLYVGDLSSEVTEGMLFEIFNQIGPVASIRVCRDAVTRRSLGYAYVNFHGAADAERALEQMNNAPIKGKLCRIMWSQRDPTMRKSGAGNIFIKNLDKSIDHKTLHDTFAMFGNILSCKVVTDSNGESKGYGFVHYDSEDAASKAIAKVNNMSIANKVVFVAPFLPKKARQSDDATGPRYTNLYVKNLPDSVQTNNQLEAMFAQYGKITSVWFATENISKSALAKRQADLAARRAKGELIASSDGVDESTAAAEKEADDAKKAAAAKAKASSSSSDSKSASTSDAKPEAGKDGEEMIVHSKGFGFVNFESADQAFGAVQALNNKEVEGKILYVGRAQKKQERESELRHAAEQRKAERISKYQGVNLYVKNLEDSIDDDKLRDEFKSHGTITSCRVMRDDKGISRGFGFVCFATSDEATRAVTDLNGKMVGSKPIYVALAQRKEIRRAQLEQQHARRGVPKPVQGGLTPNPAAGMYAPGAPVFYAPPAAQAQAAYVYPPQMQQMMPRNAPPQQRQGAWGAPQQQYAMAQQMQQPYVGPVAGRAGGIPVPQQQQQRRGPNVNNQQQQQRRQQQQQQARPVADIATTMQQMAAAPLDPKRIAELPVESQKLVLGEKLYPLIHQSQPELAGKITGMLLDSYFSEEIIHLIETPDALAAKILEALAVLEQHAAKQGR